MCIMILKIVEDVSLKDTFHMTKIAISLSIFSQVSFFNNYFLKLLQKFKKPVLTSEQWPQPSRPRKKYLLPLLKISFHALIQQNQMPIFTFTKILRFPHQIYIYFLFFYYIQHIINN